ncbi:hypothetical protein I4U23_016478 [Adineta vaga]|nr:hypothetical protein I4U23_016478 [Adineta vaga]
MVRNLVNRLWQSLLNLNLFKKSSSNEQSLEEERLSTLEYNPSYKRFSQLNHHYPTTLNCPCSKFAISYDKFVTPQVKFHQICSHEFIKQIWLDRLFMNQNSSSESINDFRIFLSFFWQTISNLCMTSNISWNNVFESFRSTRIITPTLVSEEIIQKQIEEGLRNQIIHSKTTLIRNLYALQSITKANHVVSALQTNYYLRYPPEHLGTSEPPRMTARKFDNCTCLNTHGCPRPATIFDNSSHLITIPGIIIDCLIVDGTLASTLECYYNQSCISLLHGQLTKTIQPLANNLNKYFSINSTIQSIWNELMIDETTLINRFDLYFTECNSALCSYSYSHRFDVFFIFTTVTGVIGILSFILRFIVPFIAKFILRRKNRILPEENIIDSALSKQNRSTRNYCRMLLDRLCTSFFSLNFFEKKRQCSPIDISRQQLMTRVFILLIIFSSIAIGFYHIIVEEPQIITVPHPSLSTYEELYSEHGEALYCPCSQIFVPYKTFLNVTFLLHQVCSSDFVSREWLNYIIAFDPAHLSLPYTSGFGGDFRRIGVSYFQLLSTFCELVEMNIVDALDVFLNTEFIIDRVPPSSRFMQQSKAMMDSFIRSTRNAFVHTLTALYLIFTTNIDAYPDSSIFVKSSCSCGSFADSCIATPELYSNTSDGYVDRIYLYLEVLYFSCSSLRSFLPSTTHWWYNPVYVKPIQETYLEVIHDRPVPTIKPLNASIWTRFQNLNTETLLDEMLLENITNNDIYFDRFYNKCAPSFCSYTIVQCRNYIVILFLIISTCSGLNQGLQLLVPLLGKILIILFGRWKNRNTRQGSSTIQNRSIHFLHSFYQKIRNLNVYQTEITDEENLHQRKIYTRIYLFLYIIVLGIILFRTAFIEHRISKTHYSPSIDDYEQLLSRYSDNLNCPCTHVTIPYNEFITELQVTSYHEACNFKRLYSMTAAGMSFGAISNDGRERFSLWFEPFYESFDKLCSLVKTHTENSNNIFITSTMFTNQLLSRNPFMIEIDETLNQFERKTKTDFAQLLNLVRSITQGNSLLRVSSQTWNLHASNEGKGNNATFYSVPSTIYKSQKNTNCSCITMRKCTRPRQAFLQNSAHIISGIVTGCDQLETTLLSSLSRFYSTSCVRIIRDDIDKGPPSLPKTFSVLNRTKTRFSVNSTIENMTYELFIESWTRSISYERYFNNCLPRYCTYVYYQRFNLLEILTTFLSVYAGLSLAIHFIVPYLVKITKILLTSCRNILH